MKKEIVTKLLKTIYYDGDYTPQWQEEDDNGNFNETNRYLGFPALDGDMNSFYLIYTTDDQIIIYYDGGNWKPTEELLQLLKDTFPSLSVTVKDDADEAYGYHSFYVLMQEKQK